MDLRELTGNALCLVLAHHPATLPCVRTTKRLDAAAVPRSLLVAADSPEPLRLLVSLSLAPQHAPVLPLPVNLCIVVLAGPEGSGRASLAARLLSVCGNRLRAVPLLTDGCVILAVQGLSCLPQSCTHLGHSVTLAWYIRVADAALTSCCAENHSDVKNDPMLMLALMLS